MVNELFETNPAQVIVAPGTSHETQWDDFMMDLENMELAERYWQQIPKIGNDIRNGGDGV